MVHTKFFGKHSPKLGGIEVLKYIGPGFLVTVGFIDPGNWVSNMAAGSNYGYYLLWIITLSTLMLVVIQHYAAHLGIVTGLCLSEASTKFFRKWMSKAFLMTAVLASISTALAEILGAAVGLNMLFGIPVMTGSVLTALLTGYMLFSNNYRKIERWIIGFVSIIGLSFLFELSMVRVEWGEALKCWLAPSFPPGSLPVMMSVLGAVVMPHNIFLHSEIIQSRQWNLEEEEVVNRQLRFEFTDTLFAMAVGWAVNSAMILVAASVFYGRGTEVTELTQVGATLRPLLGDAASLVFALALVFSGFASSITAAMAGGSIFAGIFKEPLDLSDSHSRTGIVITVAGALLLIFFLKSPFEGILWSQIVLSIQLPWTIVALIGLTSSAKVMGKFANPVGHKIVLWIIAIIVSCLNVALLVQLI